MMQRTMLRTRCDIPTQKILPPPAPAAKSTPFFKERENARKFLSNVNEKRIEVEKESLSTLTDLQQVVKEDIQTLKKFFSKD